jgi:DNA-binding CsgD family transcriptional regulator
VHIARRATSGPFDQGDVDALARVTGAIARGIRASLRFDAARRINGVEAPGLVVLGPGDEVELITPPARELLAAMRPDTTEHAGDAMATPVLALASFVRGAPEAARSGSNVVTVPGSDGWITLHASLPGAPGDRRVAVVLERASGARSATVRLEAFGATAREREIATLLACGLSRAEMAEALVLSPHTVDDHVKSLYDKLGVASRQELVARVFLDEYLPEVVRRTPLTSNGRFDRD